MENRIIEDAIAHGSTHVSAHRAILLRLYLRWLARSAFVCVTAQAIAAVAFRSAVFVELTAVGVVFLVAAVWIPVQLLRTEKVEQAALWTSLTVAAVIPAVTFSLPRLFVAMLSIPLMPALLGASYLRGHTLRLVTWAGIAAGAASAAMGLSLPDTARLPHGPIDALNVIFFVAGATNVALLLRQYSSRLLENVARTERGKHALHVALGDLERNRDRLELRVSERTTELNAINAELARSRDVAMAAVRAKGEFLANMSHEIRTPLHAIVGMTDLLLDSGVNAEQREYSEVIQSSGEILSTVINDILEMSKLESGPVELEPAPFDVRLCVEEALDSATLPAARKQLELAYRCEDGVPHVVVGDAGRLRRVLSNLLSNAVKFTDRGEVFVSVSAKDLGDRTYEIELAVRDTGIGMSAEEATLLFQPFVQVDGSLARRFGGTGLGLVVSSRFVQAMGGRMWVDSKPGHGCTVHFTVLTGAAAANAAPSDALLRVARTRTPHSRIAPLPRTRLLVAEDNAVNRRVAHGFLRKLGQEPDIVVNGREAVRATIDRSYDVILMDIQMPELDGHEATRRIRTELPAAQQPWIIAMTAHAVTGDRERCLAAGMNDYIAKPIHVEELAAALRRAIAPKSKAHSIAPASAGAIDQAVLSALAEAIGPEEIGPIVAEFLENADELVSSMEREHAGGSAAGVQAAAHQLKSSSAAVGAMALSECVASIEKAAREGNLSSDDAMKELRARATSAGTALRALPSPFI